MASKKQVKAGSVCIGGGARISVQSMLNTPAGDIEASVRQAKALEAAGCEIIRATVPDMAAVRTVAALKEAVSAPIVADIHFDYRMALEAAAAGADKIRINPGNIGADDRVKAVADACRQRGAAHPHRREFRLGGKRDLGEIRRANGRGAGGKRPVPREPAEQIRF